MEQTIHTGIAPQMEWVETKGNAHACKASWRNYQHALDCFKRAERDLGETVTFIAASLTTVTAVQAGITLAKHELGLSTEILQIAFKSYIAVIILILLIGFVRASSAMRRRTQAERDIDQTKRALFEFCPMDQWPKNEE